jgi:hypothetical protein
MFFSTFCRGFSAFSLFAAAGRPAVKNKTRKCRDISQGKQHGQKGICHNTGFMDFPENDSRFSLAVAADAYSRLDSIRAVIDGVKVTIGAGLCGILTAEVHLTVALHTRGNVRSKGRKSQSLKGLFTLHKSPHKRRQGGFCLFFMAGAAGFMQIGAVDGRDGIFCRPHGMHLVTVIALRGTGIA